VGGHESAVGATMGVVQTRRLGRTGHHSTVAVLGAAAFWVASPEEAEAGWRLAREAGVNHVDVAPQYGLAEEHLGPLLRPARDEVFLGCKTLRKDPDGVRAQAETSLNLLRTDRFDLYQAHAVTGLDVLEERSRAIEAMLAMRDEGV
jgi:aryl-alcohol dehydrogenase-like predicted oxidoreductase